MDKHYLFYGNSQNHSECWHLLVIFYFPISLKCLNYDIINIFIWAKINKLVSAWNKPGDVAIWNSFASNKNCFMNCADFADAVSQQWNPQYHLCVFQWKTSHLKEGVFNGYNKLVASEWTLQRPYKKGIKAKEVCVPLFYRRNTFSVLNKSSIVRTSQNGDSGILCATLHAFFAQY